MTKSRRLRSSGATPGYARCKGVDEPLLGHHMFFRANSFAGNFAPCSLNQLGSLSQEASLGARACMVTKCINAVAAPSFRGAPATARREREWKPESATQCDLHGFGCQRGVRIAAWGWPGAKRRRADQPRSAGVQRVLGCEPIGAPGADVLRASRPS